MNAQEARKLTDPRAIANKKAEIVLQTKLIEEAISSSVEKGLYFAQVNIPVHLEVKKHFEALGYTIAGMGGWVNHIQTKTEIRW